MYALILLLDQPRKKQGDYIWERKGSKGLSANFRGPKEKPVEQLFTLWLLLGELLRKLDSVGHNPLFYLILVGRSVSET